MYYSNAINAILENLVCLIEQYRIPEKFMEGYSVNALTTNEIRKTIWGCKENPFVPLPENAANVIGAAWTLSLEPQKILFNINGYDIRNSDRPTQDIVSDCEVLTSQDVEWILRGQPPAFTQANIP
ncbi:hypothetical protein CAEBREN_22645 [Caenorhabditis brenneri]|uniref:Uncharacterized protein n=1 Tax=Caenorhabditis brenneri TaxID=135651 RepID=G0P2L3_CAEBE|nr:hypothetical protein CAEBREN_22645 [Caenorhabditis brenneri]